MWEKVMSIQYTAFGIRTHDLSNMSRHPWPIDQGSV